MQFQANQIDQNSDDTTLINFLTSAPIAQFYLLTLDQIKILRLALIFVPINAQAPNRTQEQAKLLLNQRSLQLPANKQHLKDEFKSNLEQIKNLKRWKYSLALVFLTLSSIMVAGFVFTKSKTQASVTTSLITDEKIIGIIVTVFFVGTCWWAYIDWKCDKLCQFHWKGKIIRQLEEYENRQEQIRMILNAS